MVKIKLLINSLFGGGAEKQFTQLATRLHGSQVLALEKSTEDKRSGLSPVLLSQHGPADSAIWKTASLNNYSKSLALLCKPEHTVISFMERANITNILAAKRSRHLTIICERTRPSGEFTGLRGLVMKPLIKKYYPLADLLIANSAGVKKDLIENFSVPAKKIKVIPNSCDTAFIGQEAKKPLSEAWDKVFKRQVIITNGRLTEAKGYWHLIRIFKTLKETLPETALVFVGDGEMKLYLAELARESGLKVSTGSTPPPDADIYFTGYQDNPHSFVSKAAIFASTSLWEGFPNSLLEAMAAGVPVISTDCLAGPREILAPKTNWKHGLTKTESTVNGFLMPVFSGLRRKASTHLEPAEQVWAETLVQLLKDKEKLSACAANARNRAADFEFSKILPLWEELTHLWHTP